MSLALQKISCTQLMTSWGLLTGLGIDAAEEVSVDEQAHLIRARV